MAENSIQIIIEGIDKASPEFAKAQAAVNRLSGAMGQGGKVVDTLTGKNIALQRSLQPLTQGVSTLTNRFAQLNPELALGINQIDNIAFSMTRAASRGAGFGAAIAAGFNPVTLAVVAAVTILGGLVDSLLKARDAQEKLNQAIKTGDIGALSVELKKAKEAVTELEREYADLFAIQQKVGEAGRMGADLRQKERRASEQLGEALSTQAKIEKSLADAKRAAFLETLPALEQQLGIANQISILKAREAELSRLGLNADAQALRVQISRLEIESKLAELRGRGALPEDLKKVGGLLSAGAQTGLRTDFLKTFDNLNTEIDEVGQASAKLWEEMDFGIAQANTTLTENLLKSLEKLDTTMDEVGEMTTVKWQELDNAISNANEQVKKHNEIVAGSMARTFLDNFINIIQATGTDGGVAQAALNLGATIGKEVLEAMLKELILATVLKDTLASVANQSIGGMLFESTKGFLGLGGSAGGTTPDVAVAANTTATALNTTAIQTLTTAISTSGFAGLGGGEGGPTFDFGTILEEDLAELDFSAMTDALDAAFGESASGLGDAITTLFGEGGGIFESIFGLFSSIGTSIGGLFGFKHGGMIIPNGAVKAFASGGIVRNGPVVGMVGEEGPELVARMKPAGTSKEEEGIKQSIFIVDQRPKGLGPNDVVMVVSGDMERGGRTSKAMHHVLKRGK